MKRCGLALLYALLVGALITAGCGDKKKKKRKKGNMDEPATSKESSPSEEGEASGPAALEKRTIPSVDGVPDYVDARVSSKNVAKALKLNSKAVKLHTKKKNADCLCYNTDSTTP